MKFENNINFENITVNKFKYFFIEVNFCWIIFLIGMAIENMNFFEYFGVLYLLNSNAQKLTEYHYFGSNNEQLN